MTLEHSVHHLLVELQKLRECLDGVRITVQEDRPHQGDTVLVDVFGEALDDLVGRLDEALDSGAQGHTAVTHGEPEGLIAALARCHDVHGQVSHRFATEVVYHQRMAELARLGRSRGGEWTAWAVSVAGGLDECHQPLHEAGLALLACWQSLAEGLRPQPVVVRSPARDRYSNGTR